MGYIFAHLHTGEEVLKFLDYETRSRKMFNFGTVGPDFAYAINPETEKTLHNEKALDVVNFLLENADEKTLDYALGYATHIISDVETYPVIMKYANGNFDEYVRLSLVFDALLAKRIYKTPIEKINLASKINVGKNLPESVEDLLKSGIKKVYGFEFEANKAYKKFMAFLELTYDPFLVKRMFYPLVNLIGKVNIYNLTYPVRLDEKKYEKFYEETLDATKRGIKESVAYISVKKPELSPK